MLSRFTPELLSTLSRGLSRKALSADFLAGLTVAAIALPFALAVGIGSIPESVAAADKLNPPVMGVVCAVVGGLLISLLGGSRYQIGGPSSVSIAIIYTTCAAHGPQGLFLATLIAGVILIAMSLAKLGQVIAYIPAPVTAGFTTGAAALIAIAQLKEFFGLRVSNVPTDFTEKLQFFAANFRTLDFPTLYLGAATLITIFALRRWKPKLPAYIIAIVLATVTTWFLKLDTGDTSPILTSIFKPFTGTEVRGSVATLGTRFPDFAEQVAIRHWFDNAAWPTITFDRIREMLPSGATIAIVIAIEALLSAVVADGLTGNRHKSDQELLALGASNIAASVLGAIPVTGGAARSIASINAGAQSPFAGLFHALIIAAIIIVGAPLAKHVPLAALAAVLLVVAYNMADLQRFRRLLLTPRADVAVLLITFGLTVFFGLPVAVSTGIILASLLFIKRMSEVTTLSLSSNTNPALSIDSDSTTLNRTNIPAGVEVFEINGPLFFAVADKLKDTLARLDRSPKVFILRLRRVPHIDATGLEALEQLHTNCQRRGIRLLLGGVHAQPMFELVRTGLDRRIGQENTFETLEEALNRAREIVDK